MWQRISMTCLAGFFLVGSMGTGCDPASLAPGLTGEGLNKPGSGKTLVSVTPAEKDIRDDEDVILAAAIENLPEAGEDFDGIHGAARIRWKVVEGTGGFKPVSLSEAAPAAAKVLDTIPDGDFGNIATYVPDLGASGTIKIKVEVFRPTDRTVINEFGEPHQEHVEDVSASADVVLHVNDELRLELTPPFTKLPSTGVVDLKAVFKAKDGGSEGSGEAPVDIHYDWNMTGLAGAGELQSQDTSDTAKFTAQAEAAVFTISVKTTETFADGSQRVNGPAFATVQVDPKLRTVNTFGYYIPKDESTDSNYYYIVAWLYFPKIKGALSYTIVGQDMHDFAYYGNGHTWSFTADPKTGAIAECEESGGAYRFGLSSGTGAAASAGSVIGWMNARFSGMKVIVTAVLQDQ